MECHCGVIWTRYRTLRTLHGAAWYTVPVVRCPDCVKYDAWKAEQ